ncbi:hypothetical protein WJX84_004689 [Apatococcus fuscideae]|uniref:Uncharacterized protein n=1 Tax=Apatococcus fuscideae TaxID=2026836 RepID=A0AAW1SUV8_9CHLO
MKKTKSPNTADIASIQISEEQQAAGSPALACGGGNHSIGGEPQGLPGTGGGLEGRGGGASSSPSNAWTAADQHP